MWHFLRPLTASLALALFALPALAETWSDIPYRVMPDVDPNFLALDIHAPDNAQNAPVLIMIHGGAWRIGDKVGAVGKHQVDFFTDRGFVFVSINYRLAPAHPFPAHAEDAAAAIAYVARTIAQYGGDPESLSLMGHSAGAHIAALVSVDPIYLAAEGLELSALHRTVLLDGAAYDLKANPRTGELPPLYEIPFGDDPDGWRAASPVKQIRKDTDVPSMLIVNVARRFGAKQPQKLHRTLRKAGHTSKRLQVKDRKHSSLNRQLGAPDDAYAPIIAAFLLAE